MGTCLEELPELSTLGIDEGMIRDFGGVIYRESSAWPWKNITQVVRRLSRWRRVGEWDPETARPPLIISL